MSTPSGFRGSNMPTSQQMIQAFTRAMEAISQTPILYGPNGRPLSPVGTHGIRRESAGQTGSLKGWRPRRYRSVQEESRDRAEVVRRSCDLVDNDPHAAGLVDTFAATVVGAGLVPHPNPDPDALNLDKETDQTLTRQMRAVYSRWRYHADAGQRFTFGQIQYLAKVSMMRHGEYFILLPMLDEPGRPYSLACQVIHPSRIKTPVDLISRGDIRDGIEIGDYGQPVAAWIKKSGRQGNINQPDIKANFLRIPFRKGHRRCVLHGFVAKDAEQVRGWPFLSPALKYFRSFNDLLDAELISNVITSALSYFIETVGGDDPWSMASRRATSTDLSTNGNGSQMTRRYEEINPGLVMYGEPNQKPHILSANRPGTTFEPFTKTVKKSLSLAAGLPYVIGFKDYEETQFAGARMAMLDAWRVFSMEREWLASGLCQPIFTALMEEAWLRGDIDYPVENFYRDMDLVTGCDWRGAPKGDIEPVKSTQSDVLLYKNNLKTREQCIIERGGDPRRVTRQLEEENEDLTDRGLPVYGPETATEQASDTQNEENDNAE